MFAALHLCVSDMNRDALTWTGMGGLRHKSRHKSTEMPRVSGFHPARHEEGRRFCVFDVVQPPRLQQKTATAFSLFGTKNWQKKIRKRDHRETRVAWQIKKNPRDLNPDNPPATNAQMWN